MTAPVLPIDTVFHPTDLSRASHLAFVHALRIALAGEAELTIFHVLRDPHAQLDWSRFPGVRTTLEDWGLLPAGSGRSAIAELGLRVEKIQARGHRPLDALREYLRESPPQLVAIATHGRDGVPRWLHRSVAEPVARLARAMTLFVRHGARGFVDPKDGSVRLRRILVPIARQPHAQPALRAAAALARAFALEEVEFTLCHVGRPQEAPALAPPERAGWRWGTLDLPDGSLVPRLLDAAGALDPDLIVMATQGHRSARDALFGNTTERLLRQAGCPVLALPETT